MFVKKILTLLLVNIHKYRNSFLLTLMLGIMIPGKAQTWSLQQCLDTAQVYNKSLQISRNQVAISLKKQSEARASFIPKVSLNADYKYYEELPYQYMPQSAFGGPVGLFKEIQMGVPHNMGAYLQFSVPLYNSQIHGSVEILKAAAELSGQQYRKSEELVVVEVTTLYYSAQILLHQVAFIDSNLLNTTTLLRNMELLYSQMVIKKSDVTRVELQKEQLITQKDLAENNYEQILNALKFSIGLPLEQDLHIDSDIRQTTLSIYPYSHPVDLGIASTRGKLLRSELHALKTSRLPSVSFFGTYGQMGMGYDQSPNDFLDFHPISFAGVQVSVPLFNGLVTSRKIDQKELEIRNNDLQIAMLTEQNQMQAANAMRLRSIKEKSIGDTYMQIELASSIYHEILLQQKEGTASLTDVLLADNALRESQQHYLAAIIDYLKADLELKKITGNISLKN